MLTKKTNSRFETFGARGDKKPNNNFNSDYGYGGGYGMDDENDIQDDPYAFDIDLDDAKAPSENELGK